MSTSRKSRAKRKRRSPRSNTNSASKSSTPEPKFIETCKQLLNQITSIDDSNPFHELIKSTDTLYKEYKNINTNPISFKTIHTRLHSKPCHYSNYESFNEDVKKIFNQEKRLKNFKGDNNNIVKKRIQKAKRVQNYWNTLTASYEQYGFDNIINNNKNNNNKNDDNKEEEEKPKKNRSSQRQKKNKKVLNNIKKRIKNNIESETPNKMRKLNDNKTEWISTNKNKNKNKNNYINLSDDDDKKEEIEINNNKYYTMTDSPYTPFADKSNVFKTLMGSSDALFKSLKIKKRLDFGPKINNSNNSNNNNNNNNNNYNFNENNNNKIMNTFQIKWRYENSTDLQYYTIESDRMDNAVKNFFQLHQQSKVKILTVQLTKHGSVFK